MLQNIKTYYSQKPKKKNSQFEVSQPNVLDYIYGEYI